MLQMLDFWPKCTKFSFRRGSMHPRPRWESLQLSPPRKNWPVRLA